VADYPFTTLHPVLGIAQVGDSDLVLADLPGLVEGAHEGAGLGDRFLRHVARTRVLLHLVDVAGGPDDALRSFHTIRQELRLAGLGLEDRPSLVVVSRADLVEDPVPVAEALAEACGAPVPVLSAATGRGVAEILGRLLSLVESSRREEPWPAGVEAPVEGCRLRASRALWESAMALRVNIRKLKQLLWLLACWPSPTPVGPSTTSTPPSRRASTPRASSRCFEDILKRDIDDASRNKHKAAAYTADRYEKVWQALVNGEVRKGAEDPRRRPLRSPPRPWCPARRRHRDLDGALRARSGAALRGPVLQGRGAAGGAAAGAHRGKVRQLHLSEGDPLKPPYDAPPFNGKVLAIGPQEIKFVWGEGEATITPQLGVAGKGLPFDQFAIPADEDPLASIEERRPSPSRSHPASG
jgi:hypothetical protein